MKRTFKTATAAVVALLCAVCASIAEGDVRNAELEQKRLVKLQIGSRYQLFTGTTFLSFCSYQCFRKGFFAKCCDEFYECVCT